MNMKEHIELKIKEAEGLYTNIVQQEEEAGKAKQQIIGRIAAYQDMLERVKNHRSELQSEREETDSKDEC